MTLNLHGMDYGAIVFDFDGVLADSEQAWGKAEAALCHAFDVTYSTELAAKTTGVGLDDAVGLLLAECPRPVDLGAARTLLRGLASCYFPSATSAIPGACDAVTRLRTHLQVGVASNCEQPLLDRMLAGIGLADMFTTVVSASEVGAPKPAPDVYLTATDRLAVEPRQTIVIEDSWTGAIAARTAGCYVIGFRLASPHVDLTVCGHQELLELLLPEKAARLCS